jgi:hypothetical protein
MSYQKDYDNYRANIYNQGAAIVADYDGSNDIATKQIALQKLQSLMQSFDSYTKQYIAGFSANPYIQSQVAAYVNPRFHDFYDFFNGIISTWQTQLSQLAQTTGAVGGSAVASPQSVPIGCTAGICGPVPPSPAPSTQLIGVASGAPNAQGVISTVTSGGGGTVGNNTPIGAGGLAPSPYLSDLPGLVSATPSPSSTSVLTAGIGGKFDLKTFLKSPLVLAGAGLAILIFIFKNARP